jgi:hypothetical protein
MRKILVTLACLGSIVLASPLAGAQSISEEAAASLAFMREEEKLAHDVYFLFDGLYGGLEPGSKVFAHIADSETRHTEAIAELLVKYGLDDPAIDNEPGEFDDADLQVLYDTLVAIGRSGYEEALGVGVLIERKDMTDIVAAIDVCIAYPDIVQVYSNLLTGSEHHLDAFLKVLDKFPESGSKPNPSMRDAH